VLFSAAYGPHAGVREPWKLRDVRLVSSAFASEEARGNLREERRRDLDGLLKGMELSPGTPPSEAPDLSDVALPEKDVPILLAAIRSRAPHLFTGDFRHFGRYYGETVHGVLIVSPSEYLRSRGEGNG
jgi:hypothetical protein